MVMAFPVTVKNFLSIWVLWVVATDANSTFLKSNLKSLVAVTLSLVKVTETVVPWTKGSSNNNTYLSTN